MKKKLSSILIALASIFGVSAVTQVPAAPVSAGGYYRGYGCVNGRCGSVHAYSYRTPTFGHMHHWPWGCTVVHIERDFGSYVAISYAGRC